MSSRWTLTECRSSTIHFWYRRRLWSAHSIALGLAANAFLPVKSTDLSNPAKRFQENVAIFGDILGVNEFADRPVRLLSLGQRMRAEIMISLLHDPQILFLDEPTIGLDVLVKDKIRAAIRELSKERGTTVILTSHDMADIEQLSHQLLLLDQGRVKFSGTQTDFTNAHKASTKYRFRLSSSCSHPLLDKACEEEPGVYSISETFIEHSGDLLSKLCATLPLSSLSVEEQRVSSKSITDSHSSLCHRT